MKLKAKFFIVILSVIISFNCNKSFDSISSYDDLYEVEKYKVYSAIIDAEINPDLIFILNTTASRFWKQAEFNQALIFILDTTASGFWIQNENPSYLSLFVACTILTCSIC